MANYSIISEIKNKITSELLEDEAILQAISSPDVTDAGGLLNTHIFEYPKTPSSIGKEITFLTLRLCTARENKENAQDIWMKALLEITVFSHESCMHTDNIPGISASRTDYIAGLLEAKFNGRTDLGADPEKLNLLGRLELTKNLEGFFSPGYYYRKLTFATRNISPYACESW